MKGNEKAYQSWQDGTHSVNEFDKGTRMNITDKINIT